MRVGRNGRIPALLGDEHGITAVIVAVSLVGLMAALMLSVDAGNIWQSRRQIITATDASALQEAKKASLQGPTAACQSWQGILQSNAGSDVQPVGCTVTTGLLPGNGYVSVDARKPVAVRFGGVFGIGDTTAYSFSAARWQYATQILGLRPIGFCVQNQHVQEWLQHVNLGTPLPAPGGPAHPTGYAGAGLVHHVDWEKQFQDGACGNVAGNWGWVDLNGGNNATPDLDQWLREGYNGNAVGVGDCNADNATPAESCSGDTGSKSALKSALDSLIGTTFPVIVYDTATQTGSNADFHIFGFLGVKLWGFNVQGANNQRYLDVEFTYLDATGGSKCCTAFVPGTDLGARVLRLCAIDHDPVSAASRCQ